MSDNTVLADVIITYPGVADPREVIAALIQEVKNLRRDLEDIREDVALERAELCEMRCHQERSEKILDVYICPDERIFDEVCSERTLIEDAARRKTAASKEYGSRISSLEDRLEYLEEIQLPTGPQPAQRDRAQVLMALLAANGGKMLARDARKTMRLSKSRMSELLRSMRDQIDVKPYHLNKNWKVISLR